MKWAPEVHKGPRSCLSLSLKISYHPAIPIPQHAHWSRALMFSFICVWINDLLNNGEAGDLGRNRAHYGATLMKIRQFYGICAGYYWWCYSHWLTRSCAVSWHFEREIKSREGCFGFHGINEFTYVIILNVLFRCLFMEGIVMYRPENPLCHFTFTESICIRFPCLRVSGRM